MTGMSIESDMIGFVDNTLRLYFTLIIILLFSSFRMLKLQMILISIGTEFSFKEFKTLKPRKIWGCDSPIELFLTVGDGSFRLSPMIQTMISEDGYIASNYHTLWNDKTSEENLKIISEADFYFPKEKLAVLCDLKRISFIRQS